MAKKVTVKATIVDTKYNLAGFVLSGPAKKLGQLGDSEVEVVKSVQELCTLGFKNHQIQCEAANRRIREVGNFKINQLPMNVFANGELVPFDNRVMLVARYVKDNQNYGFDVQFSDNRVLPISYMNLLSLCAWFRPGNFQIRHVGNKVHVSGTKGCSIENLPKKLLDTVSEPSKAKKTRTPAKVADTSGANPTLEAGFDILDVYGVITGYHGQVIKLAGDTYIPASDTGDKAVSQFYDLGIGEVASPKLKFNPSKLNVNAEFKKVGVVKVTFPNDTHVRKITTFIHRTKSIFHAGETKLDRFGIAVPSQFEKPLIDALSQSLATERITDPNITKPLNQVIDADSLAFYKVRTSGLELISKAKRKKSILSTQQLVELLNEQYKLTLISKALGPKGGLMKAIKDKIGTAGIAKIKDKIPFGVFADMSDEKLRYLESIGFDVYSGAYNPPTEGVKKYPESTSKLEINYELAGCSADKLTGAKIIELVKAGDTDKLPADVISAIKPVVAIADLQEAYKMASDRYYKAVDMLDELAKVLWMHNASMFIEGGFTSIHTHDAGDWQVEASRLKNGIRYRNTKNDKLSIKVAGVSIG